MRALPALSVLLLAACVEEADLVRTASPCTAKADDGTVSPLSFGARYAGRRRLGAWRVREGERDLGEVQESCVAKQAPAGAEARVVDPVVGLREDPADPSSRIADLNAGERVSLSGEGELVLVTRDGLPRGFAPRTSFAVPADLASLARELGKRSGENLPWAIESFVRLLPEAQRDPALVAWLHGLAPRGKEPKDGEQLRRAYLALGVDALKGTPLERDACEVVFALEDDPAPRWKFLDLCGRRQRLSDVLGEKAAQLPAFTSVSCPDKTEPLIDDADGSTRAWACLRGKAATLFVSDGERVATLGEVPVSGRGEECGTFLRELHAGGFGACVVRTTATCGDPLPSTDELRCFALATGAPPKSLTRQLTEASWVMDYLDCDEDTHDCPTGKVRLPQVDELWQLSWYSGAASAIACLQPDPDGLDERPAEVWRVKAGAIERIAEEKRCTPELWRRAW